MSHTSIDLLSEKILLYTFWVMRMCENTGSQSLRWRTEAHQLEIAASPEETLTFAMVFGKRYLLSE